MRLASANGVPMGALLRHLRFLNAASIKEFDSNFFAGLAAALIARTPVTEAELIAMGFPFSPKGPHQTRWLLGAGKYRAGAPVGAGWLQYCPQCLAEDADPYFRRMWRLVPVTCCIKHELVLLDECPSCRRRLSTMAMSTSCPHCIDPADISGADDDGPKQLPYAAAPHVRASPLGLAAQAIVLHQLEIAGTATEREACLLSKLTQDIFRSRRQSLESRPMGLRPIERHILLAASAQRLGVTETKIVDAEEGHRLWLFNVGRPLARDFFARRAAQNAAQLRDGLQRARGIQPDTHTATICPTAAKYFHIKTLNDPTVAADTYWHLMLTELKRNRN